MGTTPRSSSPLNSTRLKKAMQACRGEAVQAGCQAGQHKVKTARQACRGEAGQAVRAALVGMWLCGPQSSAATVVNTGLPAIPATPGHHTTPLATLPVAPTSIKCSPSAMAEPTRLYRCCCRAGMTRRMAT
jgi:hypothetical protein